MSFVKTTASAASACCLLALSCDPPQSDPAPSTRDVQSVQVEVGPSVLHVGPTSFTLTWTTKLPQTSTARLTGPGGVSQEMPTPKSRHHKQTFTALEPGTTYAYEIDGRFRGEVETDDNGSHQRFAVFGHPGGSQRAGTFPFGSVNSALEDASADFALCTGDACYFTTEASFKRDFFSPFQRFLRARPIYLTAGNHEAGFPSLEGAEFAVFRELFPYPFKAEVTPFYSFIRGDIEFFAIAYGPLGDGEMEKQLRWLESSLSASRAEFRVIFLGDGHSPQGFNRAAMFEAAKAGGVDAVFGGDGFGVRMNQDDGVPYFFAGSGGVDPHSMFLVEQRDYVLHIGLYSSSLKRLGPNITLRSQRPKSAVADLLPRLKVVSKGASPKRSTCEVVKLGLEAGSLDGVELSVTNPTDKPARIEFFWFPRGTKNAGFYQEVFRVLEPKETAKLRYRIPRLSPRGGIPVALERLRIAMTTKEGVEGLNILDHMSSCSGFVDPLLGDR